MSDPSAIYTGPERRGDQTAHMQAIEAIIARIVKEALAEHETNERNMWQRAFPDGDADGHREYHQAKINAARAEEAFWKAIKMKLAESGIVGAIRLVMYLIFIGLAATVASKIGVLPAFIAWIGK